METACEISCVTNWRSRQDRLQLSTIIMAVAVVKRPYALPEIFNGEEKQGFSDWVDHFESIAVVNGWNADDKKKCIRAQLIRRAATAYKHRTAEETADYDAIIVALKRRFEPEC